MYANLNQSKESHLKYLDATRGIAALMVMAYHYINWIYEGRTEAKWASIVFNGSDAVSFFFVLSGFVLSYKYIVLNSVLDIRKFYVNRLFRLWPAYFITILLNALNINRGDLSLHNLKQVFMLNRSYFWEEAFLLRGRSNFYLPGWTLVIELALSFFIPFVIVIAKKDARLVLWLLLAYLLIGNTMRDLYMFNFHFTLGVLVSCIFTQVNNPSFRETKWFRYKYIILLVAFILYSVRHIDRLFQLGPTYTYMAGYLGITFFHYTAIASFVFIVAVVVSKRLQKMLNHPVLLFFGKISYGIYLMHWLLVVDVFQNWNKILPLFAKTSYAFVVTFFVYAAVTILLAALLHYLIESPFIKMGKRITSKMRPSIKIT